MAAVEVVQEPGHEVAAAVRAGGHLEAWPLLFWMGASLLLPFWWGASLWALKMLRTLRTLRDAKGC